MAGRPAGAKTGSGAAQPTPFQVRFNDGWQVKAW
jgi:hypothetical protein